MHHVLRTKSMLAAILVVSLASPVWAQERPLGDTVEGLLDYARVRNPNYAAMRLDAEAARERIYPAGALPDPMFRTELQDVTNYGSDGNFNLLPSRVGSTKYTISQPLPFWGKRDLKRELAQAEADAAQGLATVSWAEQSTRIKTSFAQYFAMSRLIGLSKDVLDLLQRIEGISRVRYAGGLAPQQDAIRVQVETTAMRSELLQMEAEYRNTRTRLNALLGRPGNTPLLDPARLPALPASSQLDATALEARLRERNPQLFADDAKIRAAEKSRELTYKNRYPDFTVGISPIQMRNRVNEWEVMVELNIPLQQESRRSQEREAERMLDAAKARKEASANQLLADLSENLAGLDTSQRTEHLLVSSLLPQAELTYRSALTGYETGKTDFATLLDAQRQIRKARQDIIKTQVEQQTRLAEIERLIGENL
jgi:cobalt-zinc-cadmium efflux system outer membrane protein